MTATQRTVRVIVAFAAALAVAVVSACGGSNSSTTSTTPTVVAGPSTESFEGTLTRNGSSFFSFTVQATGDAFVMLASVTSTTAPGSSLNTILGLGLGTPLGTDCVVTTSVLAFPALQSPLVSNLTAGVYCVRVYDVGNLTGNVNFAIRIVHT